MLKGLVDAIAQDRMDDAVKGLPGLLRIQRELEVRTVLAIYLLQHGDKLLELEVEDPRNTSQISERADQAGFRIKHAMQIGKDVRFLQAHETTDYERYLLCLKSTRSYLYISRS